MREVFFFFLFSSPIIFMFCVILGYLIIKCGVTFVYLYNDLGGPTVKRTYFTISKYNKILSN
jgi:Sec-independent protein secretion pathway component TatC